MRPVLSYRFGHFELDLSTGELRRNGVRVRLHIQPFQVLQVLLSRPGELVTREEISRQLWPEGTFVDYDHGVNSAVNRLREALGDKAASPRFIETLARRGYRFLGPVEVIREEPTEAPLLKEEHSQGGVLENVLAQPEDLPESSSSVVLVLFVLLQMMYFGFYVGALANFAEIYDLLSPLSWAKGAFGLVMVSAAVMIPVRAFLLFAPIFRAPAFRSQFLRIWPLVSLMDLLWALSPFLLLHHISAGLALACVPPLVYAPFAQRSLVLMGAGSAGKK